MPSPQTSGAGDVKVLDRTNTKTKNLVLSLQTGLRKKYTNFLKCGPLHLVSSEEFHKGKQLKFGTMSILCIKKSVQRAREHLSR